jgi:DNA-binding CsgD family transcriptional regulator
MATNRRGRRTLGSQAVELTDKQKEVVTLAEEGLTAAQAAERLNIAVTGVYNHVRKIREKGIEVAFAKADTANGAAAAAATNGGATADADLTAIAKGALSTDAGKYLSALQEVEQACRARRNDITEEIKALRAEDDALAERMEELGRRTIEAKQVADHIAALA